MDLVSELLDEYDLLPDTPATLEQRMRAVRNPRGLADKALATYVLTGASLTEQIAKARADELLAAVLADEQ